LLQNIVLYCNVKLVVDSNNVNACWIIFKN
jgi:hypothetical protein